MEAASARHHVWENAMHPDDTSDLVLCCVCGERKPRSAMKKIFIRTGKVGQGRCRACHYAREREREAAHPGQAKARSDRWVEKHRVEHNENNRRSKEKRRVANLAYNAAYREAHREKLRLAGRVYSASHPEQHKATTRTWRARRKNAGGSHTAADVARQTTAQKGRCFWCRKPLPVGKARHVDHVMPLSRGGSNGPENIVIACQTCNQRKSWKLPHEWPEGGRLL